MIHLIIKIPTYCSPPQQNAFKCPHCRHRVHLILFAAGHWNISLVEQKQRIGENFKCIGSEIVKGEKFWRCKLQSDLALPLPFLELGKAAHHQVLHLDTGMTQFEIFGCHVAVCRAVSRWQTCPLFIFRNVSILIASL